MSRCVETPLWSNGPNKDNFVAGGEWKKMSNEPQKSSDMDSMQRTSKEIITRVRKLRWAGMDEEAEQLLKELEPQPAASAAAQSVVPTRLETD